MNCLRLLLLSLISVVFSVESRRVPAGFIGGQNGDRAPDQSMMNKSTEQESQVSQLKTVYRYLPIGDSYTIGAGVTEAERWPNQLEAQLPQIKLIGNPARSGWTTAQAIETELPEAERLKPDLITVLIGTNDYFQHVDEKVFHANYVRLLDGLQHALAPGGRLVVITNPNFEPTPYAKKFLPGEKITQGLAAFNAIIKKEAKARNIPVADIFGIATKLQHEPGMQVEDGLHPSSAQYRIWVANILPVVRAALSNDSADSGSAARSPQH